MRVEGLAGLDDEDRVVPEPTVSVEVAITDNDRIEMIDESVNGGSPSNPNGGNDRECGGDGHKILVERGCQTDPKEFIKPRKLLKKKSFPLCCFDKSQTMTSINKLLDKK